MFIISIGTVLPTPPAFGARWGLQITMTPVGLSSSDTQHTPPSCTCLVLSRFPVQPQLNAGQNPVAVGGTWHTLSVPRGPVPCTLCVNYLI